MKSIVEWKGGKKNGKDEWKGGQWKDSRMVGWKDRWRTSWKNKEVMVASRVTVVEC